MGEELISGGVAVAIIMGLVNDLKPLLKRLAPAVFNVPDAPWPLFSRLLGIAAAFVIASAGLAPEWAVEAGTAGIVLLGVILGHTASLAHDGASGIPDVLGSILGRSPSQPKATDQYVEPGSRSSP